MRKLLLITIILLLSIEAYAQIGSQTGSYYPSSGGPKVTGTIKMNPVEDYFIFKGNGGDRQKISYADIQSIVTDKDSLISLYYFDGDKQKFYLGRLEISNKVKIFSKLKVSTYTSSAMVVNPGYNSAYNSQVPDVAKAPVFVKDPDSKYGAYKEYFFVQDTSQETIKMTEDNFADVLVIALTDYPDMIDQLQNGKYKFKNLFQVINTYRARKSGKLSK